MSRRNRNPNWASGTVTASSLKHVPSEFELYARELGLSERDYVTSVKLRTWCERNKNRCFVPEWLLQEWRMTVESDAA